MLFRSCGIEAHANDGDHRDLHGILHSFPTRRSSDLAVSACLRTRREAAFPRVSRRPSEQRKVPPGEGAEMGADGDEHLLVQVAHPQAGGHTHPGGCSHHEGVGDGPESPTHEAAPASGSDAGASGRLTQLACATLSGPFRKSFGGGWSSGRVVQIEAAGAVQSFFQAAAPLVRNEDRKSRFPSRNVAG